MDKVAYAVSGIVDNFSLCLFIFSKYSITIKYCFWNHRKVNQRREREAFLHVVENLKTCIYCCDE